MSYRQRLFVLGLLDAFIIAVAVVMAYFLRFDFHIEMQYFINVPYVILAHIILIFIAFSTEKVYRRVWQYASIGEMVSLVKAITFAEIIFFLFDQMIRSRVTNFVVPQSIYLLSWVLIILGSGGTRFAWRIIRDTYFKLKLRKIGCRTLIIGAGEAGVLIARELKGSTDSGIYPVAFIDDERSKWNLQILGLSVVGGREHIPQVVDKYQIQLIIIAMPSVSKVETSKIIEICKNTKAKIKILPRVSDLVSKEVSINMIRKVNVEDLLGRDQVMVDLGGIADYVTDQVVLVTGAGGSIGSEICRQIMSFKPEKLVLLGHGENSIYDIQMELNKSFPDASFETIIADIKDRQRMSEVFTKFQPSVVFHAAAHKHVPLMEFNPAEAIKNNILGTRNVAECAHEYGVDRFVMISTDKAVNPMSVMGVSKRVAEMYVQGLGRFSQTKFVTVRFGNVLGSRGSVIPLFKRQIKQGGPITVTHPEMIRFFMTIPEAVQLVIQAGSFANGGEVFILDMGKPMKIEDLARDLIRLSGLEPDEDIQITYTGIRPGEKLYEDIMTSEEGISATKHNRIFVGKSADFSWDWLLFKIKKLELLVAKKEIVQAEEIKALLAEIVPTYMASKDASIIESNVIKGSFKQQDLA